MDPATAAAIGQAASSVIGGALDAFGVGSSDGPDHLRKRTRQANFAAIEGKMQAAKEFGISPLYALGAPTISPAVSVGGSSGPSLGQTISNMGSDVSRAVAAGQTEVERQLQALTLDKARLENEYLSAQIASVRTRTVRESAPAIPGLIPEKVAPPQRTTGVNIGVPIDSNPYFSDAQSLEDRYGELGGSILGLGNLPADFGYNWWRHLKSSVKRDFGWEW